MSLGYVIADDRYFKRDDVGIIYQMNVVPEHQRSLIAATLLKAQFERSAYGCKLYCCWCAQDMEANWFWEAMGFVPLAFRAGSAKKSRMHIFWQKRIRAGDATTPWWFPSADDGRERSGRIGWCLPIPPGTHWSDAKPLILPPEQTPQLEAPRAAREKTPKPPRVKRPARPSISRSSQMWFVPHPPPPHRARRSRRSRGPRSPRPGTIRSWWPRCGELRDRWLEQVNELTTDDVAKYDVSRAIARDEGMKLLPAA